MNVNESVLATITPIRTFSDNRGSLSELWREDTLPKDIQPCMAYISTTKSGVVRGPHEHVDQTDNFMFVEGQVDLHLWSKDGRVHEVHQVGKDNPVHVVVPPGIVHAYMNMGLEPVNILNMPNRLYKGRGSSEPVDEIRHELDPNTIYRLDEESEPLLPTLIVTGAAGFIGSAFCHLAASLGYEIIAWDSKEYYAHNTQTWETLPAKISVPNDIADAKWVFEEFLPHLLKPEARQSIVHVVNFAAETHNDRSFDRPLDFFETNVLGALKLYESFSRSSLCTPNVSRFLQVSTDEVYGPILNGSVDETHPLNPTSPYAQSKAHAEQALQCLYRNKLGADLIITRGGNTYGPRQHPEKMIPMLLTRLMQDKSYPVYIPDAVREWQHVSDHCSAILLALNKGVPGEVYNISSGREASSQSVRDHLIERLLIHLPVSKQHMTSLAQFVSGMRGDAHDARYSMSSAKLRALGVLPNSGFRLETGLQLTVDWYARNVEWWKPIVNSHEFRLYMANKYPMCKG